MADALQSYASEAVIVTMGGIPLSGFGEGTHVTVEYNGDGTTMKQGNDGSVARAISPIRTATITLSFLQTASANAELYALWAADQVSKGAGAVPISVEDLSGGMLFAAASAWITKPPSQTFAAAVENREWKIVAVVADVSKLLTFT